MQLHTIQLRQRQVLSLGMNACHECGHNISEAEDIVTVKSWAQPSCFQASLFHAGSSFSPSQVRLRQSSCLACLCHLCHRKQVTLGRALASSALGYRVIPVQPVVSRVWSVEILCSFRASIPASVIPLMPCKDSSSRFGHPSAKATTAVSVS